VFAAKQCNQAVKSRRFSARLRANGRTYDLDVGQKGKVRTWSDKARNRPGVDGDAVRIIIGCAGDEYAAAARSRSVWAPSASLASPCPVSPSRAFDQGQFAASARELWRMKASLETAMKAADVMTRQVITAVCQRLYRGNLYEHHLNCRRQKRVS